MVGRGSAVLIFGALSLATVARQPIFLSNGPYFSALHLLLGYLMDQLCTYKLGWGKGQEVHDIVFGALSLAVVAKQPI
jgi:hypothetical protein